ncbi:hypothetical protein Cni_G23764 [Canna indica]|uniref:Uncharacterized protein n=1 Tax=Canna indica TaxID=4628 RepID=A0AAQ3QMJ8_9LILI|nr:hypothetical protein Cni_G23764 [Canna indica]
MSSARSKPGPRTVSRIGHNLSGLRLRGVKDYKLKGPKELKPSCRVGASFVYRMYRLASSRTKEAFWRGQSFYDSFPLIAIVGLPQLPSFVTSG